MKMKNKLAKLSHPPRLTKSRNIGKINNCFTVIKFQQVDTHHIPNSAYLGILVNDPMHVLHLQFTVCVIIGNLT